MSKPVIGRPVKDKAEEQFKNCIKKNLTRNMLECKILEQVYILFVNKDFQKLDEAEVKNVFKHYSLAPYYQLLYQLKSIQGTTVSGK